MRPSSQYNVILTNKIASLQISLLIQLSRTNNFLSTISFTKDDIAKIIKNLNLNKAHSFDMISIRMIKICGESILKPLELIFKSCLENGKFSNEWKKANVVPVHKRNNKQLVENYRPISLLPVCGKIPERLIYNKMFEFFTGNELISQNQSRFKPGDSVNYYVSLTIFINHLMAALRQEPSFLIYQTHLIKFGTRIFSSSCSKTAYQATFLMLSPIFCIRENKELF